MLSAGRREESSRALGKRPYRGTTVIRRSKFSLRMREWSDSQLKLAKFKSLHKAIICFLVLSMIVLSILPSKAGPTSPPNISQFQILPSGIVTPYDRLLVRVNVTSDIGIAEVGIYFRIGPAGLSFNSTSDYQKERMYPILGNEKNGLWEYRFENQSAGTTIYFLIVAIDSARLSR